jgi:hypothetical protein
MSSFMNGPNYPFIDTLEKYEKVGRFRRLVPLDKIGIYYRAQWMNKNAPRIVLNEDDEATYCDKPCKV